MSGSWGIQHGISRNNHVVFLDNDSRTRKIILQHAKTKLGINVMNATLSTVGASACKPSEPNQVNYYSPATLPHLSHEAYALYSLALVGKQAAFDGAVDGVSLGYLLETLETRLSILNTDLSNIYNAGFINHTSISLSYVTREAYALYSLALVGKQAAFDGAVDGVSLGYLLETIETRLSILHRDLEKICKSKGVA